jgi:hypothetical protein
MKTSKERRTTAKQALNNKAQGAVLYKIEWILRIAVLTSSTLEKLDP